MLVHALQFLPHQKTLPPGCLDSLHLYLPFPAMKSEHQPQENVSQARPSICLCHWHHRELQQSGDRRTQCQGRGRWHLFNPVTALRTLKPTLGFLSETRAAHKPSSSVPMAIHPARDAMPTHELAETLPLLGSRCHLPVVTLH